MKILYLNHALRENGNYFRAFDIAREMVRRGHPATLLTASPKHNYRTQEDIVKGVRVIETPSWNPMIQREDGWGPLDVAYRLGKVLVNNFDLVYAFSPSPSVYLPTRMAQVLKRKPMVVDWCDVYRNGVFSLREEVRTHLNSKGTRLALQRLAETIMGKLERRIVRQAKGVTVVSKELERAARFEGVEESNLLHLPAGTNLADKKVLDKDECRKRLLHENGEAGLDGEGPFVGYVAGDRHQNEELLLHALKPVFKRFPKARLLAMGAPFSQSVLDRTGVGNHIIRFDSSSRNLGDIIQGASDVLAFPLDNTTCNRAGWPEGFGDLLAAGRPVVTNSVGDVGDYFPAKEKMFRWLGAPPADDFPLGDDEPEEDPSQIHNAQTRVIWNTGVAGVPEPLPVGLAVSISGKEYGQALNTLLARPDRWTRMGISARMTAEARLDWSQLSGKIERFLENFVK